MFVRTKSEQINSQNTIKSEIIYSQQCLYICAMDVKQFLLKSKELNLSGIAELMWPTNKSAASYLSRKLHGIDNRTFTQKDAALALKVLNELGVKISQLKE